MSQNKSVYWANAANAAVVGANIYAIFLAALGIYVPGAGLIFHLAAILLCGFVLANNAPKE